MISPGRRARNAKNSCQRCRVHRPGTGLLREMSLLRPLSSCHLPRTSMGLVPVPGPVLLQGRPSTLLGCPRIMTTDRYQRRLRRSLAREKSCSVLLSQQPSQEVDTPHLLLSQGKGIRLSCCLPPHPQENMLTGSRTFSCRFPRRVEVVIKLLV